MRKQLQFQVPPPRILGGFDYEPVTPPDAMQVPGYDTGYTETQEYAQPQYIPEPGAYSSLAGLNPNSITDEIARLEEEYRRDLRRLDTDERFGPVEPVFRNTQLPIPQAPALNTGRVRAAGRDSSKKALILASLFGAAGAPLAGLKAANKVIDTSTGIARQGMMDDFDMQRFAADFEARQADRIARNDNAYNAIEARRAMSESNRRSQERRKAEGELGDKYAVNVRATTEKARIEQRAKAEEARNRVSVIRSQISKIGMLTPQGQEELAKNISEFMGSEFGSSEYFRDMPADVAASLIVKKDANSIKAQIAKMQDATRRQIASDKAAQADRHFEQMMTYRNASLVALQEHRAAQSAISALRAEGKTGDKRYENAKSTTIRLEKQAGAIQQRIKGHRQTIANTRKELIALHRNENFIGQMRNDNPFLDRLNDTGTKIGERLVETLNQAIEAEKAEMDRYSAKMGEVTAALNAANALANQQANAVMPYMPTIDPRATPEGGAPPPNGFRGSGSIAEFGKAIKGKGVNFYGGGKK